MYYKDLTPLLFLLTGCLAAGTLPSGPGPPTASGALPPVLSEIERIVREEFWDPGLKGIDWSGAVARAGRELALAKTESEKNRIYDGLLAALEDSHTFRVPAGTLPEHGLFTAGLRIGREGEGFAVKGVIPGSAAERAGLSLGDRILAVEGRKYGAEKVSFRDLFLVFEGTAGSSVAVTWQPTGGGGPKTSRLPRTPEEPGDTLVWKSARVFSRGGKAYGYARLWGVSTETALAVVDLLIDREQTSTIKPELAGWGEIAGFLLDARANSGGYDPNILTTFLRGRWSSGDYFVRSRQGRRLEPPVYQPLPVVLLVNSATASAGEALALKFRQHRIGPVVGETTAGMASGGAASRKLSDGSQLWFSVRMLEDTGGRMYEGRGVAPDILVADRPAARPGREEDIVEAGLKALASQEGRGGRR